MANELLQRAQEFIKEGRLHDAERLLRMAATEGASPEEVADGFRRLALSFRKAGLLESAIAALIEAKRYGSEQGLDPVIQHWQRTFYREGWLMARKDAARSSQAPASVLGQQLRLQQSWFHRFSHPVDAGNLLNFAAPIVAKDRIIAPAPSLKALVSLDLQTGELVGRTDVLSETPLTYASTPVYVPPYIVLCIDGRMLCFDFSKEKWQEHEILIKPEFRTVPYCVPFGAEDKAVFAFRDGLWIYEPATKQQRFTKFEWASENDLPTAPVLLEGKILVLSRGGWLHRLSLEGDFIEGEAIQLIDDRKVMCSAPCVCGSNIFFEAISLDGQNTRQACCYALRENRPYLRELTDEICSLDHIHFNYSPITYRDGALVSSDVYAKVYRVRCVGDILILPFDINVQTGPHKVVDVSHIFSSVVGTYLISKTTLGFFYLNLENPEDNDMVLFHSRDEDIAGHEVIAQPVVYQDRVIFLCRDGLRCYTIQR